MWQKATKGILAAHNAVKQLIGFLLFCVMSGMLGAVLWECIDKKTEWIDKLMLALLCVSLSIIYGFQMYTIIILRRHGKNVGLTYLMLCGSLFFYIASIFVGYFIASQS